MSNTVYFNLYSNLLFSTNHKMVEFQWVLTNFGTLYQEIVYGSRSRVVEFDFQYPMNALKTKYF